MATAAAEPGKRVALVIGNSAYDYASPLANPCNDAEAIAAALERVGFTSVDRYRDLNQKTLMNALLAFRKKVNGADIAVIYFAGHGLEVGNTNYLIPVDAELGDAAAPRYQAVPLDMVLDSVEAAKQLQLVILDACRDNPFVKRMRAVDASRSIRVNLGFASIEPHGNMLVAYAAKHGTQALDGADKHSPYAEALLQFIEKPDIEIQYLFREVRDWVIQKTNSNQIPHIYGTLGAGKIYLSPIHRDEQDLTRDAEETFRKYEIETTENIELVQNWLDQFRYRAVMYARIATDRLKSLVETDAQEWAAAIQVDSIAAYEAYLRKSPHGQYLKQANDRIATLNENLDWLAASRQDTIAAYDHYSNIWPDGLHAADVKARIEELREDQDWNRVIEESSVDVLREFVRTWPNGRHQAEARQWLTQLEAELAWRHIELSDKIADFDAFLVKYGPSKLGEQAKARRDALQAERDAKQLWEQIKSSELLGDFAKFLEKFSQTALAVSATSKMDFLRKRATVDAEETAWRRIELSFQPQDFEKFLRDYPAGPHALNAEMRAKRLRVDLLKWEEAKSRNTIEAYENFLSATQHMLFHSEAEARIQKLKLTRDGTAHGNNSTTWQKFGWIWIITALLFFALLLALAR